jgi:ubiquitin C-terminal hydrolase
MEQIAEQEETVINGIYGLDNLGNTCYLNSIIQTLANIDLFRMFLLNKDFVNFLMHKIESNPDPNIKTKLSIVYDSPLYQFFRIIQTIWNGSIDSESLKPTTLKKKLGLLNSMFKNSQQQDAQEAFTILIEMMHMEIAQKLEIDIDTQTLNPIQTACVNFWAKEYSPLYEIFHGMYLTIRTCNECNHITEEYYPNLFLSLDIPKPGTKSLFHESNSSTTPFNILNYIDIRSKIPSIIIDQSTKELMCSKINEDIIESIREKHEIIVNLNATYDISECINDFTSEKIIDDFKCPECKQKCSCSSKTRMVILPQVLCIQIKRFGNNLKKRDNLITFPINLDIQSIVSTNINPNLNTKYKLKSVINHSGSTLNLGHYYTYAYSPIHEKWYNFNDETVTEISELELITPNAYLLFYELEK